MAIVMLAIVGLLGWYLGNRVYSVFAHFKLFPNKVLFWVVFGVACIGLIYTRSPLIAVMLYGIMLLALGDIISVILRQAGAEGVWRLFSVIWQGGATPLAIGLAIMLFGMHNAANPVLKAYDVSISKSFGGAGSLNIAMVADLHMGTSVKEGDITEMVDSLNALNADIICFCGDVFDEGTSDELREKTIAAMGRLTAAYGVFYITGNHDTSAAESCAGLFRAAGVTVLEDECILIDGRFYLAGRSDPGHGGGSRPALAEVLTGTDPTLPVILLDHRPGSLEESKIAGVDLQLSGHTHAGQLWPFGPVAAASNKVGYGHVSDGDFNIIVTSGYGTWGFPVRTGSRCEYTAIQVLGAP